MSNRQTKPINNLCAHTFSSAGSIVAWATVSILKYLNTCLFDKCICARCFFFNFSVDFAIWDFLASTQQSARFFLLLLRRLWSIYIFIFFFGILINPWIMDAQDTECLACWVHPNKCSVCCFCRLVLFVCFSREKHFASIFFVVFFFFIRF